LLQDVTELYTSPHANHVIAKLIEIMPVRNLASIGEAMRGKATTVARHQFGSRILERLIEHCGEDELGFLFDELLEDFEALARHQFGNFVVARLLEHGTAARNYSCVQKLLPHVLQHATHKTACNIVQRMLEHADLTCQAMIADAFLAGIGETSLEAIAATRYGSFVIQHLVDRFHPRIDAVKTRIKAAHTQLKASGFSQRKIVQFLGEGFFRD
jgi:pumilio RNA-binding family